jgi:hypothetical protein
MNSQLLKRDLETGHKTDCLNKNPRLLKMNSCLQKGLWDEYTGAMPIGSACSSGHTRKERARLRKTMEDGYDSDDGWFEAYVKREIEMNEATKKKAKEKPIVKKEKAVEHKLLPSYSAW